MFQKNNKGYLLLEGIVSIFIFLLIIFFINRYTVYIFKNKFNINEDYNQLKIEIDFFEELYKTIKLRDIASNDISISDNSIIVRKYGSYIKYEFKNNGIYISNSKKIDGKYGKNIKILGCDEVKFSNVNDLLIVDLEYKGVKFEKVIKL